MNNIKINVMRFLTLLFIICSTSFHAQAALDCRKHAKMPSVRVVEGSTAIKTDLTKSRAHLTGQEKSFSVKGFSDTLGLTTLDYRVTLEYSIQTLTDNRQKLECHWFDSIIIKIHAEQTVFIASEFTTDLCMKNEINHHEMKHVMINRKFINDINQTLKREVQLHARYNTLIKGQPIDQGAYIKNLMGSKLERHISDIKDKHLAYNMKQQALIDTPEEYKKVSLACN